ncbi:MAG TPA: MlaD family protein [Actinomycetota bacterium]
MSRLALHRVVVGVLGISLAVGGYFLIRSRYGAYDDVYHVTTELPKATQLLRVGTDVRLSGVIIGKVSEIRLAEREVEMLLRIESRYRVPASAEAYVDLKTLLGDKFVDLRYDSYNGPFLAEGDRIVGHVGPELEDVIATGAQVLRAVDPLDAATVVHELAIAAEGHGEDIARGLDAGTKVTTTFRRTLPEQVRSLIDFDVIFGELRFRTGDLGDLADAINQGVPVYASDEAHAQLRRSLEQVAFLATHLGDLLVLERDGWDRLIDDGDVLLQVLVDHREGLRGLVNGLSRYVMKLGGDPYPLFDGSAAAAFTNFIGGEGLEETIVQICGTVPPEIEDLIPICEAR